MTPQELSDFIANLPVHLRFFFDPPPKNLEPEEFVTQTREHMAKVRQHRDELLAHGIDADRFLKNMEESVRELEASNDKVEKVEDELLNARADLADAEYDLFLTNRKALEKLEEEKPFDPRVQEVREQMDEWAKHFPRE